jgi:hypothetical protein
VARASVREDPRDATATPDTAAAPFALVAARFGLVALAGVTAAAYFTWRTGVGNPALPAWSWFVLAVEAAGFLRLLMFIVPTVRMPRTEPPRPVPGLAVDVFVTTCDEEPDVVRRTVMAAVAIRYPHETWLLDDGNRLEMRRLAREAGCRYVARTTHEDAKGGNLNHALTLARGAFVAFFDADHVAAAHFLDRTLGYFRDERTAFVQTPQEFFNFDSYQHLVAGRTESSAESFFNRIVQRSRNASNAVLFCGSGAVMRRAALDEIGGFPTGTVTEDVQASVRPARARLARGLSCRDPVGRTRCVRRSGLSVAADALDARRGPSGRARRPAAPSRTHVRGTFHLPRPGARNPRELAAGAMVLVAGRRAAHRACAVPDGRPHVCRLFSAVLFRFDLGL